MNRITRFTLLLSLLLLLVFAVPALAQEATPEPVPAPEVQFVGIDMPEWYTNAFTTFVVLVPVVVVVLSVAGIVLPVMFFRVLLTLAQLTKTESDDNAIIDWAVRSGYIVTFDEDGNILIVADDDEDTPTVTTTFSRN